MLSQMILSLWASQQFPQKPLILSHAIPWYEAKQSLLLTQEKFPHTESSNSLKLNKVFSSNKKITAHWDKAKMKYYMVPISCQMFLG